MANQLTKITLFFSIVWLSISCETKSKPLLNEQIIFSRLEYIFNLKPLISSKFWNDFDLKQYDLPLIYFTENNSYIVNPTKAFLKHYSPKLVFKNPKIKIFKTLKRFDNQYFHMETSNNLVDKVTNFMIPFPVMSCSSFEVTSKNVPNTNSTEYWSTMIIHEYFHGFQYRHTSYLDFVEKNLFKISEDSLTNVYKMNNWFQKKMKQENDYLLKSLHSVDKLNANKYIDSFFRVRALRRLETKSKLNFDIELYETNYETMEGTARYIEYRLQKEYSKMKPNQQLQDVDKFYKSNKEFINYKLSNDPWMYKVGARYFYSTGFNMIRIFDKLNIEYKSKLFKINNLTLEKLLFEFNLQNKRTK